MADITTSIKIEADASKAVSEMQRLQSATENLKKTGKEVVITPEVKAPAVSGGGPVKIDVDASSIKSSSAAAAAAVSDISNQYQQAAISAQNAGVSASTVNANIASTATASAVAVDNLGDSFQAAAIRVQAASDAQNVYNTYIATGAKEEEAVAAAVNKYNEAIAKSVRIIGGGTTTTRDWTAEAKRAATSINEATVAAEKHEKAVTGIRGSINKAAEAYKNFSSGAASGLDGIRSISMNLIADFMLIKRTAETAFDFGGKIYEFFAKSNDGLNLAAIRTLEVEKAFQKAGLTAKTPVDAVTELNKKIEETSKAIADMPTIPSLTPEEQKIDPRNDPVIWQVKMQQEKLDTLNKEKDAQISLRDEIVATMRASSRRAADRTGLALLDEEAKIRKEAEYDIADLKAKLLLIEDKDEKDNIQTQVENRKKLMNKQLEDLAEKNKQKEVEKQKETQRLKDETRAAEIANLTDQAKIEESYLFDLDKISRRIKEAQNEDERKSLEALARAREAQRDRELKDFRDAQKKANEEIAKEQKEKAKDAAEYQKSLMEEMIGYQKQLVASFSGLQQSVFPKEAMGYLRQIAGAANKFP